MNEARRGTSPSPLPRSLVFIERDWLSSNQLVGFNTGAGAGDSTGGGRGPARGEVAVVVDTGYGSRSAMTLALVDEVLEGRPLERIVNTHGHSDHIGGNAALKARHHCRIQVPTGLARALALDPDGALHASMGQACPPFEVDATYAAGDRLLIGDLEWEAYGSPGHDNDSLVLYQREHRLLVSGDALWQNGFGILFPLFDGETAFEQEAETLEMIASLAVDVVMPGHGPLFGDAPAAVERAVRKLAYLRENPERHAWLAMKVALSFVLLDRRSLPLASLADDFGGLELVQRINEASFGLPRDVLATRIRDELVATGMARLDGDRLLAPGG